MLYLYFITILSSTKAFHLSSPFDIRIDSYKVDTTRDLIIHTSQPKLSWKVPVSLKRNVKQVAYQMQVRWHENQWNSEKIFSNRSIHVSVMNGTNLQSATYYYLRLRLWTTLSNQSTLWTNWIHFRTSIFNLHEYIIERNHTTHWIGSTEIYMNELRKEFNITNESSIRTAIALVSGLGYYELYINGDKIDSSRKLDPGWTTYEKRTLFNSFDLTSNIKIGMNAIGIKLGNGWYSEEQYLLSSHSEAIYGPPRLLFILNIVFENTQEIQICSDQTWSGRQGSILHDSIYNGEIIDARYERSHWSEVGFHDRLSLWLTPEIMPSPIDMNLNGQYTFQDMPPIRVGNDALHSEINISSEYMNAIIGVSLYDGGILKPISVSTPVSGIHIFDLGQNMIGWCRVHFHGSRGIAVQIRHAEILTQPVISTRKSSELPYVENLRSATQTDIYILQGDANGELYEPRFTVHGFRYISVFGSPNSLSLNDVECPVVHSETTVKGYFTTSNEVINQIQHNIQWSQLNNLMSIPTDCPQRDERKGWLADASLSINEALYNFDLNKFYINFLNLIIDIQRKDGSIPDTVPFTSGNYPADPNWGTALPTIVWQLYRHYQDCAILQTYHKHIRAYIESIHSDYNKTGLIKLNYHYGDWVSPPPHSMTNVHLISSFAFLHDVYILINISQILAIDEDIKAYSELYQQLTDEFHRVFYTSSAGYYADGMQAAQILALALPNVVPNQIRQYVVEYLVKNIHDQGDHITTGIISTAQLFTVLSDNGYHDLSVELISAITYPSYGYMFNNPYENATTLWELWDAPFEGAEMNSRNHIMFGSIGSWFYTHLAGIEYQSDMIIIRPRMVSERKKYLLDRIHCQISTLHGLVDVSYTRNEKDTFSNSILLQITIPSNMKAKIIFEPLFPHAQCVLLTEGDKIIWSDVQGNINDKDYDVLYNSDTKLMVVQINSGHYEYQAFWS